MPSKHGTGSPRDRLSQHAAARAPQPGAAPAAIALRAYELFVRRGATHGHDLDDWLEAEQQLVRLAVEKPWPS